MKSSHAPLFVDLDGTLIASDSLFESLLVRVKSRPTDLLKIPGWLARGRAYLKARLADDDRLNVERLPYREDFCAYLRAERGKGRSIHLATAADARIARRVAGHLGLFDRVLASDGKINLKGPRKLAAIRALAGDSFAYAGNGREDIVIWQVAESAILVNVSRAVARRVESGGKVERVFPLNEGLARELIRSVRIHQWLKNLLVFVPLLTSFRITQIGAVLHAAMAFVAFSLCASSTYVVNDLFDLDSDRAHPRKRFRPLASGRLGIPAGFVIAAIAMCLGLSVAACDSYSLFVVILAYIVMTTAYSLYLKTRVLMDVMVLAALYAIRIVGGGVAISVRLSIWLTAFALFIFLSLALLKRCSELMALKSSGAETALGRNYSVEDLNVFWPMGMATAVCSVLVFALYVNSSDMPRSYATPSLLWLVALGLFYWLGRMWIKTSRGEMTDDPLVFALKDFGSRFVIASMVVVTLVAYFVRLP